MKTLPTSPNFENEGISRVVLSSTTVNEVLQPVDEAIDFHPAPVLNDY